MPGTISNMVGHQIILLAIYFSGGSSGGLGGGGPGGQEKEGKMPQRVCTNAARFST